MALTPALEQFVADAGWAGALAMPITPDWSPRLFWRLVRGDRRVVLVHAAVVIPGHGLDDVERISAILNDAGLSAPRVLAHKGDMMLVEDFGDTPIDTPAVEKAGYETAVDALAVMRGIPAGGLVDYYDGYIYKRLPMFSDKPEWMAAWVHAEAQLPPCPAVFSHMDYKAGNLHWLPERAGVQRVGILDFQAAQRAPFTYDIVNLLEDARRDIEPDLKASLKARFKAGLPQGWQAMFDDRYVFTAAQFHARVWGQLRIRSNVSADVGPRLVAYLQQASQHPILSFLKDYL